MRNTSRTPSPARRRGLSSRLAGLTAAALLALAGCAQDGPGAEPDPTPQESTVQSTPEPTDAVSATPSAPPSSSVSGTPSPAAPPTTSGVSGSLTISIAQDASTEPVRYTLDCVDGVPGPATTLPNADAACAALARLGTRFFTAKPNKDVICTQQYGGPQTASITGELEGTRIRASFALTDGCQISRWNQVSDILGAPGAQ